MSTDKGYQCDLIGVYLHFSSSRLVYEGAVRSFSTIAQAVLYQPMLQLEISNVKIFVNYFKKERKDVKFHSTINSRGRKEKRKIVCKIVHHYFFAEPQIVCHTACTLPAVRKLSSLPCSSSLLQKRAQFSLDHLKQQNKFMR